MKKYLSLFVFLIVLATSSFFPAKAESPSFEIYYLDVGQGNAAVIACEGYYLMIDGGPSNASSYVYSFLQSHHIDHIDYMVCTHPDEDHVGGLSGALNYASVGVVFCTKSAYPSDPFNDFIRYLEKQNNHVIVPDAGDTFSLGSAKVEILGPSRGKSNSGNTSIVLRVTYGKTSFLFVGDSEDKDEQALIASKAVLKSDVLCVGHHGSDTSTTSAFLKKVAPKYAVISVGLDNQHGHPSETVLSRLKKNKTIVYRTDLNGMIHCTSNGSAIIFDTEKEELEPVKDSVISTENPGEAERDIPEVAPPAAEDSRIEYTFIINKNTKKFHYPDCDSVSQMKEKNKKTYNGTAQELIDKGYSPCQKCHPEW